MKKHRIVTETELIFQWSREKSLPKHLSERVFFGLFPRRKRDTLTLSVIGTAYRRWDSLPTLDKVVVAPRALTAAIAADRDLRADRRWTRADARHDRGSGDRRLRDHR